MVEHLLYIGPISSRELIEAAKQVLKQVEYRSTGRVYNNQQVQYINYDSAMASVCIKYKLILQQFYEKAKCFYGYTFPVLSVKILKS